MRIFDDDNEKAINNVSVFLTIDEAKEMKKALKELLKKFKNDADHAHLNDEDFQHEITICIYNENNLRGFNERTKTLIDENK